MTVEKLSMLLSDRGHLKLGAGNWNGFAQRVFEHDLRVYLGLWQDLKRRVDQGTASDCFYKTIYLNLPEKTAIDSGSGTTASTL
ncbi:hypothetical protein N7489_000134 [Penicillium chrysogenum]|uniref:uncharacterized protein n=1 Tax=Penicillium chrysogenum TaxID=5076 RepID=UPI0024DF199E|nr:uncharacterized protein N7489_000134 [Penicillium chrysogenum]KAJ5249724.1 hypothetical protein N7489_000134 [Penicillium chrysogenum]